MEVRELARGLWRWEAPHPGWEPNPEPDSPADRPQLVGCVAYGTDDWIPEHGALVPGDRLLGDGDPLRMCPDSRMRYLDGFARPELRRELRKLLDLPIRMILTSHGEPALADAHAALERALAA